MKTIKINLLSLIVTFIIVGNNSTSLKAQAYLKDSTVYRKAIKNAMYPEEDKVYDKLIIIDKKNKDLVWKEVNGEDYILAIVWMRKKYIGNYQPYEGWGFYNTDKWPMWVTLAPQLKQRIKKEKAKEPEYRLKQMLGLSPASQYDYFIELWVKPTDLFRPCPDPETSDSKCDICFPKGVDSTHIKWINQNRISSFYACNLFDQVPWTALGYTYDWNPDSKSHIGLSEFIIPAHTNVVIEKIYTNKEYLNLE